MQKEFPQAKIQSAITLFSNGQIEEALVDIETLIKDYPYQPLLFNISGAFYKEIGKLDEAVKRFEKALAIKPDYAEAHNNLGVTLKDLSQLDEAVKCYEKALAIEPDYAEAHNNLGITFQELGQLDEAVECYEKALAIEPDYAEAHNNLGIALQELGQLDEAVKSYEKLFAIEPDYPQAHYNFGNALRGLGQLDEAVKSYENALAIEPNYPQAHYNLGIILRNLGQVDEAIKRFEKALDIKPDYISAHFHLSTMKRYKATDPQIAQMKSLLSTSDLSQSDRIHLCFALAKVNEDLGNQDEFFKFLHEGNRLRKEELNYSLDKDQNLFSIVKKMFSSVPSLSYEPSSIHPIFIVGMPRSGTTLVEQIIASHHAVYGAGESQTFRKLLTLIVRDHLIEDTTTASTIIGGVNMSISDMNNIPKKVFLSVRQQYLDELSSLNVPENVITNKGLLNFRFIGFILSAFPEAKIIHMKRDTMATCWSIYKSNFLEKGLGFGNNLNDLAGFYGLYTDLMDFWHQSFPDKIYDLCYEDLTTNQEEETRKLLEYCELDWDENCLDFHKNKRAVKTASALQVREKMYQGSSEVWKQHEVYLEPLIKALDSY